MKVLYISCLVSEKVLEDMQSMDNRNVSHAVQKFNSLVVEGLVNNDAKVLSLSTYFPVKGGKVWHHKKENNGNIDYYYIPSINYPIIRHLWLLIYCFFYVVLWGAYKNKEKVIVCDVLNISACIGAITAAKLLKIRCLGLMTDMPGLMVDGKRLKGWFSSKISGANLNKRFLSDFTHYVFLTEQMNEVNIYKRPYIVMEGLVRNHFELSKIQKGDIRTILYAGGLHAQYGVKMLVDAVKMLPYRDIQLVLYGDGPMIAELKAEEDPRIVYAGLAPNEVIVKAEHSATLLVNPRPTNEAFTKYSFPSKNMEYMVSGTPVITTILPGMPMEYYPYVYLFDCGETAEGYAEVLDKVLKLPKEELLLKGAEAQRWILQKKNNTVQCARILKLFES